MSNPTSNFGWQMPTPTDLVTDLPADFEVFGQAVDTSLADLRGGTTGQILSKTTNADMDFTWTSANPGDITGVTAGTGISGGGTSGDVTITNDMATTITASGDIVVGTGSGTYDNLPIGTTGQILTADTTVSPYKVKWATPASGSTFVGCSLYKSANQSVANNTNTAITFDSESFDTDGFHSTSSNTSRVTIPAGKAGYYLITGTLSWAANATGGRWCYLRKNGSMVSAIAVPYAMQGSSSSGVWTAGAFSHIGNFAVSDYIELFAEQGSGGAVNINGGNVEGCVMQVQYLGA